MKKLLILILLSGCSKAQLAAMSQSLANQNAQQQPYYQQQLYYQPQPYYHQQQAPHWGYHDSHEMYVTPHYGMH